MGADKCCKNCENRRIGCHSPGVCPIYTAFLEDLAEKRAQKAVENIHKFYVSESKCRAEKNAKYYHARKSDRRYH